MADPAKDPSTENNKEKSSSQTGEYFEMYFDENNKAPYYYNPKTGKSVWTLPPGAICADMTEGNMEKLDKEYASRQEEEVVTEHQRKMIEIEELKRKNMEAMYPEYYNESNVVNEESDQGEGEADDQIEQFDKIKHLQSTDLMKRPARRQIEDTRKDTAYIEGNYDYNIWYDKYLTDRRQEEERVASMHKLNPQEDTGYTKADKFDKASYFCIYFARGACSEGVNCRYYHRVPQPEDLRDDEMVKDCFGRTKHSKFKEDFTGIGSFAQECLTLKVTDIAIPDRSKPFRDLLRIFYEAFAPWGDLVDINLNVSRCVGFVKYSHRYYAEFAREAMSNQVIFGGTDPISLCWAVNNPFERKEQEKEAQFQNEVEQLKQRQSMVNQHVKSTLKNFDKKLGTGKRKKKDDDFGGKTMDQHKRFKEQETDEVDNKQIADNLSKLSSVFQRMENQPSES